MIAWQDSRSGWWDVYAQRLNIAGTPQWTTNGVAMATAVSTQYYPAIVSNGSGRALAAWQDLRSGTYDIYAQAVGSRPVIAGVRDVPNDQGGKVRLAWEASFLDTDPATNVDTYRIWREVPAALALTALEGRVGPAREDGAAATSGGPTFRTSVAEGQTYYWEFVTSLPAYGHDGYSYIATTAFDSIPGSNPSTLFMVEARNSSSGSHWDSPPDSGYSVDNLAPATPAPFTGQYAAGTARLHWGRSPESDLAQYRLYRGNSASFVPDDASLVAAQPDTGYVDVAGAPHYYKLSAVDAHGNESPFATLVPSGTTGVDGAALPVALAFTNASANPSARGALLRLALPRAAQVRLAVYDAAGRVVRVLADGATAAGTWTREWDGRSESGGQVPSGLYFARLEVDAQRLSLRLAQVR